MVTEMGKIKGWKLQSRTKIGERFWKKKDTGQMVDVFKKGTAFKPHQWRVAISPKGKRYFEKRTPTKKFKSGVKARKYATRYMRKH